MNIVAPAPAPATSAASAADVGAGNGESLVAFGDVLGRVSATTSSSSGEAEPEREAAADQTLDTHLVLPMPMLPAQGATVPVTAVPVTTAVTVAEDPPADGAAPAAPLSTGTSSPGGLAMAPPAASPAPSPAPSPAASPAASSAPGVAAPGGAPLPALPTAQVPAPPVVSSPVPAADMVPVPEQPSDQSSNLAQPTDMEPTAPTMGGAAGDTADTPSNGSSSAQRDVAPAPALPTAGATDDGAAELGTAPSRTTIDSSASSAPSVSDGPTAGPAAPASVSPATSSSWPPSAGPAGSVSATAALGAASVATPVDTRALGHDRITNAELRRVDGMTRLGVEVSSDELGVIRVDAHDRRGVLQLSLSADDAMTRAVLEQRLPELRTDLRDAGVQLGSLDVSDRRTGEQRHNDVVSPVSDSSLSPSSPSSPSSPPVPAALTVGSSASGEHGPGVDHVDLRL